VQDTHNNEALAEALIALTGAMNSARQDGLLIHEAGVRLDRALFPLLIAIGRAGAIGIVDLADQVGRDHSTISRQIARLETLGLVVRQAGAADRRVRAATLSPQGAETVLALREARHRLMDRFLSDWPAHDRSELTRLLGRLVATVKQAQGG
jgi:DNA-binding MarR family transcriptional regulator